MKRTSFALAFGIAGCASSPNAVESTPRPSSSAVAPMEAAPPEVLPDRPGSVGLDDAPGKRQRIPTAVVLFGTRWGETDELRFVPLVCSIAGKIEMGKPCGLAMPTTAT